MKYDWFKKWRGIKLPFYVFIGCALFFFQPLVFADENETKLTLSEVVELAVARDSSVLDALDNLEIAQSNLRIAQKEKGFNPTVQVTGDIALMGEMNSNAKVSIKDSVALNETSSDLAAQFQQANIEVSQAQNALIEAQENAKLKAITIYFEILKTEWTKEIAQRTLAQSQILLGDVEKKYELGMTSSVNLLKAKQSIENARINLEQSEKSLLLKKRQLNQIIGYPLNSSPALEKEFSYQPLSDELDQFTNVALNNHTNIRDLQWKKEKEIISLKSIERNRQAKIHLIGSYVEDNYSIRFDLQSPHWLLDWTVTGQLSETDESFYTTVTNEDSFTPSSTGWGVGLEITWIPFDGGISKERKKQQEIIIAQIERKLNTLPDTITLEVFDSYNAFLQSEQAVLSAQLEKQIAEESYHIQQQQFQAGFITDRTLKESEIALHNATLNYQKAMYDYILSKVSLYRTAGKKIVIDEL